MSELYVYAFVSKPPRARLGRGLRGEALRVVRGRRACAVVGTIARAPRASAKTLRAHDEVVRRVAEVTPAVLPARFGSVAKKVAEVSRLLEERGAELARTLSLVRGAQQMTLRAFGRPRRRATSRGAKRGTAYLESARERLSPPELDELRERLKPLVVAERLEPGREPLVATIYHLVRRSKVERYRETAASALDTATPLEVRVTGPFPPYAFASGRLA